MSTVEDSDIQLGLPILDNKFILERTLGSGFSCKVKLGRDSSNTRYAVKIFTSDEHNDCANVEIEALSVLDHANIVKIYAAQQGVIRQSGKKDKQVNYIVLELISGGELFDFVSLGGRLHENTARFYFQQLISGLAYMHSKGVAHRDLKPENLMIDQSFNLKIADFGFAGPMQGRDGSGYLRSNLGTAQYKAPELHLGKKYTGEGNDLFACSVILFTMVSQRPPFSLADPKSDQLYKLLASGRADVFWQVHSKGNGGADIYSDDFKNLFESMTVLNPAKRLTLQQVVEHPWTQGELTDQNEIIQDFMRRKNAVDDEARKNKEEKKVQRAQERQSKARKVRRSNGKQGEEDGDLDDDQTEPWMQNFVKPYGAYYPKRTQFFTTAPAFEVFDELLGVLKENQVLYDISSTSLKLKFPLSHGQKTGKDQERVSAAAQSMEIEDKEQITCNIEVMEVIKDSKYCIEFSYRDQAKNDLPYKEIKKYYKDFTKSLTQYIDTTYDD